MSIEFTKHYRLAIMGLAVWLLAPRADAHGVDIQPLAGGQGVVARYQDGSPMSHAEARVRAPGESEFTFQIGATDRAGRFLFLPDAPGAWTVEIDDGLGHAARHTLNIADAHLSPLPDTPRGRPDWPGALLGILLILGLFRAYARWRATRAAGPKRSAP